MSHEPRYNPYSAPQSAALASGDNWAAGTFRAPGEALKWVFGAIASASFLLGLLRLIALSVGPSMNLAPSAALAILMLLRYGNMAIGLAWIYQAWTGVPFEARGDVTPGKAVGYMFIPLLNLKWLFDVNTRLCDALSRYLANNGESYPSPRSLALFAAIAHLVASVTGMALVAMRASQYQCLVLAVVDLLWFQYAYRCDGLRRAVVNVAARDGRWVTT